MKKIISNKKGFTLIELLVVIAIVALLSSIAMVAMNEARKDSRDTKRVADIKQVAAALEIYFNEYNKYPDNSDDPGGYNILDHNLNGSAYRWDSSCGGSSPADEFLTPLYDAGIMATLPDDPNRTNELLCYNYTSSTRTPNAYMNKYYLFAVPENAAKVQNNCGNAFNGANITFCLTQSHN